MNDPADTAAREALDDLEKLIDSYPHKGWRIWQRDILGEWPHILAALRQGVVKEQNCFACGRNIVGRWQCVCGAFSESEKRGEYSFAAEKCYAPKKVIYKHESRPDYWECSCGASSESPSCRFGEK